MNRTLLRASLVLALAAAASLWIAHLASLPAETRGLVKLVLAASALAAGAAAALRAALSRERADRASRGLLLAGVSLLVASFATEVALRALLHDVTTTSNNTSVFAKRWERRHVRTNQWRFRDREWPLPKAPGTFRIAALGDSFTFGQGIAEEDRFSNLLEKRLNEEGACVEVLNFGIPGAQTADELRVLGTPALGLDPDLVLLQWYVNDVEGTHLGGRPFRLPFGGRDVRALLMPRSALYFLVDDRWTWLQDRFGPFGSYDEYFVRRFGGPRGLTAHRKLLEEILDRCEARSISVAIVLFPRIDGPGRFPFGFAHDGVLAMCRERGIPCLDLRSVFAAYTGDVGDLRVNRFDGHASPLANRMVADGLIGLLRERIVSREAKPPPEACPSPR